MVRPRYHLNRYTTDASIREVIDTSSAQEPQNTPLRKEWLIAWSNFFCIDGSKPNLSRRIGPQYSAPLMKNPDIFPPQLEGSGTSGADPLSVGLAYRDLMSSGLAGLWSVGALIEEIKRKRPELIALSPLLSDPGQRAAALKDWLGRHARSKGPTNDGRPVEPRRQSAAALLHPVRGRDGPEYQGMRLGVLGSILVAEVVFGALQLDPLPFEVGAKSLKDALGKLSRSIYGDEKRLAGGARDRQHERADQIHRALARIWSTRTRRSSERRRYVQIKGEKHGSHADCGATRAEASHASTCGARW